MISAIRHDQAALGGLTFVILLVGSAVTLGELGGAFGDPDAVFEDYFSDSANRWRDVAGGYLLTLAGISFLVFAGGMEERLRQALGDSPLGRLASILRDSFRRSSHCLGSGLDDVSLSIIFGQAFDDQRPFNSGYAMVPQIGYVLFFIVAPLVASAHIVAVSLAFRRLYPAFVTVSIYICTLTLLFSVLFLPVLALPFWVVILALPEEQPRKSIGTDLTLWLDRVSGPPPPTS